MRCIVVLCIGFLVLPGCATLHPQALGQTIGTIVGAAVAPGVGAPVGAIVGLLTGTLLQRSVDKVTAKYERADLGQRLNTPSDGTVLTRDPGSVGAPTRVWVDETVMDGRVIAGRFDTWQIP